MFTCRHAPRALPAAVVAELARRYGEPHRAYHTAAHVDAVLAWFDRVIDDGPGWTAPDDVYVAIVFHDAIYDATRGDNEAASAALADTLVGASPRARALIELTARHGKLAAAELAGDLDAQLFLDADLAIVGAEPATFDAYDRAVRVEYAHVPDAAYRAGRGAFLRTLLGRDRLFFSDFFHARLDAPARANLARALDRL